VSELVLAAGYLSKFSDRKFSRNNAAVKYVQWNLQSEQYAAAAAAAAAAATTTTTTTTTLAISPPSGSN